MTHGERINFGRHNDELVTRVPVSYLKWMVNQRTQQWERAAEELARRGTVTPDLDLSGHAIDRASLRCRKIWHEDQKPEEGLNAWLLRICGEALAKAKPDAEGRCFHKGMKLVFEMDGVWPVLKTIMPKGER